MAHQRPWNLHTKTLWLTVNQAASTCRGEFSIFKITTVILTVTLFSITLLLWRSMGSIHEVFELLGGQGSVSVIIFIDSDKELCWTFHGTIRCPPACSRFSGVTRVGDRFHTLALSCCQKACLTLAPISDQSSIQMRNKAGKSTPSPWPEKKFLILWGSLVGRHAAALISRQP